MFGFNRCTLAVCGGGLGSASPSAGSAWSWFGGSSFAQTAVLSQNTLIESTAVTLAFDLWAGKSATTATTLTLAIDGITVWAVTEANASIYAAGYSTVGIAIGAYADGGTHAIRWDYSDSAGSVVNWSLDNVRLVGAEVPEPGSLALVGAAALGLVVARRRRT